MNKVDNPRTRQFNARMTEDEYEILRRKAFGNHKTISSYVRNVILAALSFGISDGKKKT